MNKNVEGLKGSAIETGLPIATAVRAGEFIFVSGHIGVLIPSMEIPHGIEAQTRASLQLIRQALAEHDATLAHVVKATVWLADTRDFGRYNTVWREVFRGHKVARATVRADLMEDAKIEIEVIAYKPKGGS